MIDIRAHACDYAGARARMTGRGRLSTALLVGVMAAVIAATWVVLDVFARIIGVGPILLISPLLFGAATWGLIRLRRK